MLIPRRVAGVFAICALVLSYSEALTAASCSMAGAAASAMEMPASQPSHDGGVHDSQPECPLAMPGSPFSCIFSAAIVPSAATLLTDLCGALAAQVSRTSHYRLLLADSAFHPPKA